MVSYITEPCHDMAPQRLWIFRPSSGFLVSLESVVNRNLQGSLFLVLRVANWSSKVINWTPCSTRGGAGDCKTCKIEEDFEEAYRANTQVRKLVFHRSIVFDSNLGTSGKMTMLSS